MEIEEEISDLTKNLVRDKRRIKLLKKEFIY